MSKLTLFLCCVISVFAIVSVANAGQAPKGVYLTKQEAQAKADALKGKVYKDQIEWVYDLDGNILNVRPKIQPEGYHDSNGNWIKGAPTGYHVVHDMNTGAVYWYKDDPIAFSVVYVIDASGSMSGAKLSEAKASVRGGLDYLAKKGAKGIEIALFYFSGCGNCNLVQPFTTDYEGIKKKLNFSASGGTPITFSLKKVSNYLRKNGKGDSGEIILLSDGGESCQNPNSPEKVAGDIYVKRKYFDNLK